MDIWVWNLHTPSPKRLLLLMTASTVSGITEKAVNRSVQAWATISIAVGVRSLGLRLVMKRRMALPSKAVILMVIKTVDSITTVGLLLASSWSCKVASTSTLVSPGSMLFMTADASTNESFLNTFGAPKWKFSVWPWLCIRPINVKLRSAFLHSRDKRLIDHYP